MNSAYQDYKNDPYIQELQEKANNLLASNKPTKTTITETISGYEFTPEVQNEFQKIIQLRKQHTEKYHPNAFK